MADLRVPWFLVRVDVPDDVVGQTVDAVACALCHFGEPFRLGLVLKGVAGEIDARAMNIGFDEDVDAADAIEGDLDILIVTPVAHAGHVGTFRFVLMVAYATGLVGFLVVRNHVQGRFTFRQNNVAVERIG